MKNCFFILSLIISNSTYLPAQSSEENLEKYWYYRFRLQNDFMLIGDCNGCSLPAEIRNFQTNGELLWGDVTNDLGWYISVLATEFGLLIEKNQDASQTVKELFYALKAFNRMDQSAHQI